VQHQTARVAAEGLIVSFEWVVLNRWAVALGLALFAGLAYGWRRRIRARAVAAALIALAALTLGAAPAFAVGLPHMDLADYAYDCSDVVQAEVLSTDTRWTDGGLEIETDVTLRIDDVVKGQLNKQSELRIKLPTGRVGAIMRKSDDLPEFTKGERVLLFLCCNPNGTYSVYAGSAGKYVIRETDQYDESFVMAGGAGGNGLLFAVAEELYPERAKAYREQNPLRSRPVYLSLDAFKDYIREKAKEEPKPVLATVPKPSKELPR